MSLLLNELLQLVDTGVVVVRIFNKIGTSLEQVIFADDILETKSHSL